jgi:hypothetical protein
MFFNGQFTNILAAGQTFSTANSTIFTNADLIIQNNSSSNINGNVSATCVYHQ